MDLVAGTAGFLLETQEPGVFDRRTWNVAHAITGSWIPLCHHRSSRSRRMNKDEGSEVPDAPFGVWLIEILH